MLVSDSTQGVPDGDVHQWFTRSRALVDSGDANAALLLIDRVLAEDPQSTAALEIKARALFDSKQFHEAAEVFTILTERSPDDDTDGPDRQRLLLSRGTHDRKLPCGWLPGHRCGCHV